MSAKPKEKKDKTKLKFKMKFNRWGTLLLEKIATRGALLLGTLGASVFWLCYPGI
ncbi:hypothetical protein GRH48_08705 [Campylobacter coli]|nr:hypothetical protein [Campylobacter coli]